MFAWSNRPARKGFSLVGMLVTLVCIVVLFALLMQSLNKAVTGEGSQHEGTVRSFEDKLYLVALYQSMAVGAVDNKGKYLVPSELSGSKDISQNTTANLFSAMVMKNYTTCKQLVSANEYSGYVEEYLHYDFAGYEPNKRVFWDKGFQADLAKLSHTSFAHEPLFGKRFDREWRNTMNGRFPLLGNRGPKDGVDNPQSWSYGRNGAWGGHVVYGDGHIDFINTFKPGLLYEAADRTQAEDNIFAMESGPEGGDAILSFTNKLDKNGPVLQHD
jgi:hypothetical protein